MSVDSWTDVGFDHENDAASMSTGIVVDAHEDDVISLSSDFDSSIIIDTSQTPQATLRRAGSGISRGYKADAIPRIISKTSNANTNTNTNPFVEHLDEKCAHSNTDSKRSLRHSLIKRDPVCSASMDFSRQRDEYIEVIRRPSSKDEAGSCIVSKTAVDDLITELMDAGNSLATLGRDKRWKRVQDIFDRLENEGNAVRCPAPNSSSRRYTYKPRHYRFVGPPHEMVRYSVKPNGTYRRKSSTNATHYYHGHGHAVHRRHNGRWKVWYELSSEPPLHIQRLQGITPLRGSLRAPPGSAPLRGGARKAFSPGVATICGAGSSQFNVSSTQQAVAENAVELFFGRTVAVSHASIAGKIHDTETESLRRSKGDDYGPRRNEPLVVAPGTSGKMKRRCHVAIEGTDAYCDRVEISARLPSAPKVWIVLGIFDGCRDGHTETPISLTNCDVASRNGAVHCIALRFRAASWHNRPMLRVGAYGYEIDDDDAAVKKKKSVAASISHDSTAFEDGVEYILHRWTRHEDGSDALRRRYAFKGNSLGMRWDGWEDRDSRAARRRNFRYDVKEALSY